MAHIATVKGVPFYGYHIGFRLFLKIYLFNPIHVTRLADLLRQGAVMQRAIQPFESHMQYIPQWMCDYNLFGCEYLDVAKLKFRHPVPDFEEARSLCHVWHDRTISNLLISDPSQLQRQSRSSIEVDICVHDILNRSQLRSRDLHHELLEHTDPFNNYEKVVHSMAGLWKDETTRRKTRMGLKESGSSPFPPEVLATVSADPRDVSTGGWIHESDYKARLEILANGESNYRRKENIKVGRISEVRTVFESVEDLFPVNIPSLRKHNPSRGPDLVSAANHALDVEVDENRILSLQEESCESETDDDLNFRQYLPQQEYAADGRTKDLEAPKEFERNRRNDVSDRNTAQAVNSTNGPDGKVLHHNTRTEICGVRQVGDYVIPDNDSFCVPSEYTSRIQPSFIGSKRKAEDPDEGGDIKKTKLTKDEPRAEEGCSRLAEHMQARDVTGSSCQNSASMAALSISSYGKSGSAEKKNGRLNYPVVKSNGGVRSLGRVSQQNSKSQAIAADREGQPNPGITSVPTNSTRSTDQCALASVKDPSMNHPLSGALIHMLSWSFGIESCRKILCLPTDAPTLLMPLSRDSIPSIIYQDAFFGDDDDVPERGREYAGRDFKLEGNTVPFLPEFDPLGKSLASVGSKSRVTVSKQALSSAYDLVRRTCTLRTWEFRDTPPLRDEVQSWLSRDHSDSAIHKKLSNIQQGVLSQLDGPTQQNSHGAKFPHEKGKAARSYEVQYMSVMSLEIHVNTRADLVPDPEQDEIGCIFWCLQSDDANLISNGDREGTRAGIIAVSEPGVSKRIMTQQATADVEEEPSELDMINRLVDTVHLHDPDILTGFEVHGGSWGYVIERARSRYDYDICVELSRMRSQSRGGFGRGDTWGFNHTSTVRITGRHVINIWRAMRGELNLLQYTMENIVFHLLHRRIPHYAFSELTRWYQSGRPRDTAKVINYFISRVQLDLEILDENELVARTSEQARLLGVDFFSVFSRGSQFKVESLMFRIAKPENFVLVSPSRRQVGQQNALECLPLVMEPQSAFYASPVLVLDFQSLYPSVMIAYNYCYSTFLGRVVQWRGQNKMGFTDYAREPGLVAALRDHINIAPNGIMYAKPEARKSLLAKMLGEILETRVMVKSGMKVDKGDRQLQRLLNNRQLALKLIANVTYGYTSASFSGRMPCSEIADSIVQTGREILERSIALIHSVGKWHAEVVYGDTDSLFVHLKGRTRIEAFQIGREIADTITSMNPRPIKLKFEKVYHPCVLVAKKRYVGFKYESKTQQKPEFEAKGIETVRRDGTPGEQKIEEKALKLLFRTADLSLVKGYFQRQCMKIMRGKVSVQDFCFAREVKLGTYSDRGPPPPGALISARRMLSDPRAEPQYGERVPYVVVAGAPGARLIDRCVAPETLLQNDQNELDAEYYITKNLIPPLERIFNLVGANVRQWYDEMPKFQKIRRVEASFTAASKELAVSRKTLESYMSSSTCVVCKGKVEKKSMAICSQCVEHPSASMLKLRTEVQSAEAKALNLQRVCRSCAGLPFGDEVKCDSKDCPVFYTRTRHMATLSNIKATQGPISQLLEECQEAVVDW